MTKVNYKDFTNIDQFIGLQLKIYSNVPIRWTKRQKNDIEQLQRLITEYKQKNHVELNHKDHYILVDTLKVELCNMIYTHGGQAVYVEFMTDDLKNEAVMIQDAIGTIHEGETWKTNAIDDFIYKVKHTPKGQCDIVIDIHMANRESDAANQALKQFHMYGISATSILKAYTHIQTSDATTETKKALTQQLTEALAHKNQTSIISINRILEQIEHINDPYIRKFFALIGIIEDIPIPHIITHAKRVRQLNSEYQIKGVYNHE